MMETKLWIALCALLLISLGSTEHDDGHDTASSASKSAHGGEASPEAPPAESVPGRSLDTTGHPTTAPSLNDSNPSSRGSSSVSNGTTTEDESISVTSVPKKANDTIVSPSEADNNETENNGNLRNQSTSQPPIPPSGSHIPTPHTSTLPTAPTTATATKITTTTTSGPIHTTHTTTADTPTTMPPTNTSHPAELPDSITPSNESTSVPAPEPPNPKTTTATTITTTTTQSSSTSSTGSSQKPPHSESSTLSSPQNDTGGYPKTSSKVHLNSTINPPSTSAQTKPHADHPSQLNVEGDPTMVHDSPTLDPLLAGLVSAFIITAVIITLLLFLKLRRRDNRPEFRRLQDLPMDDMMEDTPLSMYSY